MAQRVRVQIFDDLTGEEGAEPLTFSYGGHDYEIDLTVKNEEKFRKLIKPYIDAGRTTSKKNRGKITTKKQKLDVVTESASPTKVREWARSNGYEVSDRGRIPQSVMSAYNAS